jgi:hypothetical protein
MAKFWIFDGGKSNLGFTFGEVRSRILDLGMT